MSDAIQGAIRNGAIAAQGTAAMNQLAEFLVATGLPRGTEMVRRGKAWSTMSVTAVAGLVVRPSTTAALEIWNGYSGNNAPSLIIDRLFWFNLVSAQVAQGFTGWAQVTAAKATPSSAALAVRGASGKPYTGSAVNAVGTTVVDSGWFPWAVGSTKAIEATVTPNGGAVADVDGRLIVPPGCSLCLHAVAQTTASTFTQGASWYEEVITIE